MDKHVLTYMFDIRTITNPVDQQDKSINENYDILHRNQDRVEFDCPVPDVQPTENKSFLDSRSDTETESESSGDQTFIRNKYLANQVVNREGNTRKKLPSKLKTITMAQYDIMISSVTNENNNANYLWSIIRLLESEFRTRVEWLHVHKVHNPQVQTTYDFLRFVNSDIHSIVVHRLNGITHRINTEHTPRVQTLINELQSKEDVWELERLKLVDERVKLEEQLEQTTQYATQLEGQIQQHHANSVEGEIGDMEALIKVKEDTIKRWKGRAVMRSMVQISEANLENLKGRLAAKLEQAMTVTDLKAVFREASEICRVLSDDKDRLESELDELRIKNEQLSQRYSERVKQLEEENEELRGRLEQEEPLKCPVCLEVYTSERRAVTLFCSHMLCSLCHQRLTELDSSSLCPMCRGVEVTNCLHLL
ncbi:hypothetical protein BpHYR1_053362 [Brachionus plicatilis]|uniref:RING-type domain-containing protein n=1 Tax=Brachionus plicatilis TaxID=10195 RepID=A0A3M7P9Z2_BRAPC|nr:hypothetical protein BpHYR1_053362 [Brachionus plicatilis]